MASFTDNGGYRVGVGFTSRLVAFLSDLTQIVVRKNPAKESAKIYHCYPVPIISIPLHMARFFAA
jgi:hypothetical protein